MNVDDFITTFRLDMGDVEKPSLWSSDEIVRFLNEAVQEACERSKLIEDRSTQAICTIPTVQGVATYNLHPSVFEIKRITYAGGRPLDETSIEAMDQESSNWEARQGQPRRFIFEQASGALPARVRLIAIPTEAGTLSLTVYRGALKPLSADLENGKPEIPERFHKHLLHWMYRSAKLKVDSETLDRAKAKEHEMDFERQFGARPDANVQRKQRDRRPPIVQCGW